MEKECPVCHKIFKIKPSHYNNRVCCCKACLGLWYSKNLRGANNPNFKNAGVKNCIMCGAEFKSYNRKSRMCSLKCVGSFNKVPKKVIIKEEKYKIQKTCKDCGVIIYRKHVRCTKCREHHRAIKINLNCSYCMKIFSAYAYSQQRYCSAICRKEGRRTKMLGENNPNYKHGLKNITCRIRESEKNKNLIKKALVRDNYKCRSCGKIGGRLEVDHKKKFSEIFEEFIFSIKNRNITKDDIYKLALGYADFWNIDNLQVLCRSCNQDKENTWRFKNGFYLKYSVLKKESIQ